MLSTETPTHDPKPSARRDQFGHATHRLASVGSSDFPLVLAFQHPDVARVLLQFGADPLMKGPLSLTLEELAVQEERNSPQYGEEFRESARLITVSYTHLTLPTKA